MTVATFLDHLRERGATVLPTAHGAVATCSGHEDTRPSLDVTEGRDGRVLVYCRAGCRTVDVLSAVDLRLCDLFPDTLPKPSRARPRSPLAAVRAEALALARRQGWARPGVLGKYEAADAMRAADRVRELRAADDDAGWARLTAAARVTTAAENLWAEAEA